MLSDPKIENVLLSEEDPTLLPSITVSSNLQKHNLICITKIPALNLSSFLSEKSLPLRLGRLLYLDDKCSFKKFVIKIQALNFRKIVGQVE